MVGEGGAKEGRRNSVGNSHAAGDIGYGGEEKAGFVGGSTANPIFGGRLLGAPVGHVDMWIVS